MTISTFTQLLSSDQSGEYCCTFAYRSLLGTSWRNWFQVQETTSAFVYYCCHHCYFCRIAQVFFYTAMLLLIRYTQKLGKLHAGSNVLLIISCTYIFVPTYQSIGQCFESVFPHLCWIWFHFHFWGGIARVQCWSYLNGLDVSFSLW